MNPYKTEDGIPYFYLMDVENYGCPSFFGYSCFRVVDAHPVYDLTGCYSDMQGCCFKKDRLPHMYDRRQRFQIILSQLMGYSLNVSKVVRQSEKWMVVGAEISNITENYWMQCREILRRHRYQRYYNSIPAILKEFCFFKEPIRFKETDFVKIMHAFDHLEKQFKVNSHGRKYFPNLRFIALKLMEYFNVYPQVKIPMLITKKNIANLNDIFNKLMGF